MIRVWPDRICRSLLQIIYLQLMPRGLSLRQVECFSSNQNADCARVQISIIFATLLRRGIQAQLADDLTSTRICKTLGINIYLLPFSIKIKYEKSTVICIYQNAQK